MTPQTDNMEKMLEMLKGDKSMWNTYVEKMTVVSGRLMVIRGIVWGIIALGFEAWMIVTLFTYRTVTLEWWEVLISVILPVIFMWSAANTITKQR